MLADEVLRLTLEVLWVVIVFAYVVRLVSKLLELVLKVFELALRATRVAELEILPFPPSATVMDELTAARAASTLLDDLLL